MSSTPLLSVIIPFFNNEDFIVAGLRSLFDQIDDDIEVIIIDDGSTDNSTTLVRQFLAEHQHPHVIFISQQNHGIAYTRNVGLQHAQGRYITFLDGDDLLSDEYLKILRPLLMTNEYDLIDFKYQKFTSIPPSIPVSIEIKYHTYDFKNQGLACLYPLFANAMWHLWSRVYKKVLLEGEFFENGRRYEDVIFTPFQYFKTQKIAHFDHTLYFYRDNNQSITRNIKPKDIEDMLFAMDKMMSFFERNSADTPLKQLAALMVADCFSEIKNMSKTVYGYYYYSPETLHSLKRAATLCRGTSVPRKKIWQMQYPQLDTLFSKIRWYLNKR